MALAGEMLMNADGLVVNAYQDAEGRGAYFPGSSGTSEGQFLFIIGNLHAYQVTGNPIAKEQAEKALENLLRVLYRNMPVPDVVDRTHIFAPHWLFNVKYPFASSIIHYDRRALFQGGVGYITQDADKVRYVYGARSLNSTLLWENPYAPVTTGNAYAVAAHEYEPAYNRVKVTLTGGFTGELYVTHSTQTGPDVSINEPFEAWPDWRKLEPGEIACAVDVLVWAYRAFSRAAEVFNNPTWAQAAEATKQQAMVAFDVNDSRDWLKPTWANSPFASGSRFAYSTRVPAPVYSVNENGSVVMFASQLSSGAPEVQYGNASIKDVYGVNDITSVELSASETMDVQLYIDQYATYATANRFLATVKVGAGNLSTFLLTRSDFRNSANEVLPVDSPVYTFGVSSRNPSTHEVRVGRVRQLPNRVVPYYPGAIPFTANFQGQPAQLIDWRGPVYMGYQSPYMWRVMGQQAATLTDIQLLSDAQVQWKLQTGQPQTGPFAPVYIFDRDDAVQYGPANTFGWSGPDPNTRWGGYQYRPLPELTEAALISERHGTIWTQAIRVANNFVDWLAQDWPWLPMWAPWSNLAAGTIEKSLALAWSPMPVVPAGANAFASAINKASAHGYTAADTGVPMLPAWSPWDYPFMYPVDFPKRAPLGPPTDFPQGAPEINYPEPHMAALILRAVIMLDEMERPVGNTNGKMRVQYRAVLHKVMALLDALWQTEGVMAGTFSHNPDAHEWFGFWHGEILDTLASLVAWAERADINRPSVAERARYWINGMLRWAKTNTQLGASPFGGFLWRHDHNWSASATESFEFATTVFTSFSGREQRSSQRIEPRRTLSFRHSLTRADAVAYDAVLRARQNLPVLVPQWHLAMRTVADAELGQAYLDVNEIAAGLDWGGPVVVAYGGRAVQLTIASISGLRIELTAGLTMHLPAGTRVAAVCNAMFDGEQSGSRLTGSVVDANATFRVLPQEDGRKLPVLPPEMTFAVGTDIREVIMRQPNWITPPTVGHTWDINISDYPNGPLVPVNGPDQGARRIQARWTLVGRDEINAHLGLAARLHGRRYAAWIPSWTDDFELTRAVTNNGRLYVQPNSFIELGLLSDPAVGIFIRLYDGRAFTARVSSVVLGSTECLLVLDRNLGATFTLDQIHLACVLYRVRQVSDTTTLDWLTDSVAETTASFVTVFDET